MIDRLERLLGSLGRIPTAEEYEDVLRMSRRGFFGSTAAIAAGAFFAPKPPLACTVTYYEDYIIVPDYGVGFQPVTLDSLLEGGVGSVNGWSFGGWDSWETEDDRPSIPDLV